MGNGASANHSSRQKSSMADSLREPEEDENELLCLQPGYPSPRPPRNRKEDVFAPDGFYECDERGHMAPIDVSYSWGTLIQYLVWGFRSPMDKLRTLFVWMGAQDIPQRILPPIEGKEPDTPYNDIRHIQRGKMSYAMFLLKLCRACDLKCVFIRGIAKSQAYMVGDPMEKIIRLRNAWVAVYVEGDWRIIFPKWAFTPRRGSTREEEETDITLPKVKMKRRGGTINEFWFLTDPNKFAFFALPDDPKWQLLNVPFGLEKFVKIPYLYNPFFRDNMHIVSAFRGKLKALQGKTEIVIQSKNEAWDGLLMFELSTLDEKTGQSLADFAQFTKYVIMCRNRTTWTFVIRFPTSGTYLMRIKGGKSQNYMLKFCDFKIQCDNVVKKPIELPFEPSFIGWGPSLHTVKSGLLNATHKTGIISVKIHIPTLIGFDLDTKEKIHVDLLNKTINPSELEGCMNFRAANHQLNIWVTVPHESEYALCIYLKKGAKVDNVCNYLLTSIESKKKYIHESSKENPTETMVRTNLKYVTEVATSYKELDEAIKAFNKLSLEDDGDLTLAQDKRDFLKLQAELRDAMNRRFIKVLNPAIQKAEQSKFATNSTIQRLVKEAKKIVKNLKKLEEFAHPVLSLSLSTIAEIHGYRQVLPEIQDVMAATYMLLGEKIESMEDWEDIRYLMGKTEKKKSLMFRIKTFNMVDLTETVTEQVGSILEKYDIKMIHNKSSGVAAFYVWSTSIVQEKRALMQMAREQEGDTLRALQKRKGKRY